MMFFDDLVVGQQFTTRPYVVTHAEIDAFVRQFTPRQYDPDMSYRPWGSPWFAAAISSQMLAEWAIENQLRGYWHDQSVRDFQMAHPVEADNSLVLELRVAALPDATGYVVGKPEFEVRMISTGQGGTSRYDEDYLVTQEALRYRTTLSVDKRERMKDYPNPGAVT